MPFELISILLLAALVGAIAVARRASGAAIAPGPAGSGRNPGAEPAEADGNEANGEARR